MQCYKGSADATMAIKFIASETEGGAENLGLEDPCREELPANDDSTAFQKAKSSQATAATKPSTAPRRITTSLFESSTSVGEILTLFNAQIWRSFLSDTSE